MKLINQYLEAMLIIAALGQLFIAVLSLFLGRLLNWKSAVDAMPLLVREVFQIHGWFISFTVAFFGLLTLKFSGAMAHPEHEMIRWFCGGVGTFWGVRCVMQWTHYSRVHWKGILRETIIHWTLFIGYGLWAAVYWRAALGK